MLGQPMARPAQRGPSTSQSIFPRCNDGAPAGLGTADSRGTDS